MFSIGDIVEVENCGVYKVVGFENNILKTKKCLVADYKKYYIVDDDILVLINLDNYTVGENIEVIDWEDTSITECLYETVEQM